MAPSLSGNPSLVPSSSPLPTITGSPTGGPTMSPTAPTLEPSSEPSMIPSMMASEAPSTSLLPSASSQPSDEPTFIPSLSPTETEKPSPSPSALPTSVPTVSLFPSVSPSLSVQPSTTSVPSREPSLIPSIGPSNSPSDMPSSNAPSTSPSLQPSGSPSIGEPSSMPSMTPSVTMFNQSRNEVDLLFQGLPVLNQSSSQWETWNRVTSEHVFTYWESRIAAGITVTEVDTNLTQIVQNSQGDGENFETLDYLYFQRIEFGCLRTPCNLLNATPNNLFTHPFTFDSTRYVDALTTSLNLVGEDDLSMEVLVLDVTVISPGPSPINPAPSPGGKANNTTIILSVLSAIVFLAAGLFLYYFNVNRRRRQQQQQQDAIDMQQAKSFSHDEIVMSYNDGDDEFMDMQPSNFDDGSFPVRDIHPNSFLQEGGDLDSAGSYALDNNSESNVMSRSPQAGDEVLYDDEVVTSDIAMRSSFGSSEDGDDGPPSMSGFNVQVTDLDDEEEITGMFGGESLQPLPP